MRTVLADRAAAFAMQRLRAVRSAFGSQRSEEGIRAPDPEQPGRTTACPLPLRATSSRRWQRPATDDPRRRVVWDPAA